jgi:single-stranded DNA-binding protein
VLAASFRVAVNSRRPNAEGEWQDHIDWFRVRVFPGGCG